MNGTTSNNQHHRLFNHPQHPNTSPDAPQYFVGSTIATGEIVFVTVLLYVRLYFLRTLAIVAGQCSAQRFAITTI
jgi:hypothetical protein